MGKATLEVRNDLYNKLARITVLTDVLKTKVPDNNAEAGLFKEIEYNTRLVQYGVEDMIWLLNFEEDGRRLIKHVIKFAIDLFSTAGIYFKATKIDVDLRMHQLPLSRCWHLMMFFREVLLVVATVSKFTEVKLQFHQIDNSNLQFIIVGKGHNGTLAGELKEATAKVKSIRSTLSLQNSKRYTRISLMIKVR